jgi:hypothetical protein
MSGRIARTWKRSGEFRFGCPSPSGAIGHIVAGRSAGDANGSPRLGAAATGGRANDPQGGPQCGVNSEDGLVDQPTLSARRTRSGLIQGGAAVDGSAVGCPTAAAHRGSGVQSATGGPGAVDGALASGGGGETQTGAASGTVRILLESHDLKPWREKKCGAWPNSMSNTSRDGACTGSL